jgi:hypothetical protein
MVSAGVWCSGGLAHAQYAAYPAAIPPQTPAKKQNSEKQNCDKDLFWLECADQSKNE